MTRLHHDARENIRGWRRSNLISTEEGDWLEADFWGDRGESERQHANDLMKLSISVQQWCAATEFRFSILLPCDIEMEFIRVNGGRFAMGSPAGERGRLPWEKQRPVNIEAPIYNGVFEVTQHQFRAVMGRNPSFSSPLEGSEDLSVEQVSWEDIIDFLDQLTHHLEGLAHGRGTYATDIPTEEEWEYFARAGTTTAFNDGTDFSRGRSEPNMRAWINYNRSDYGMPVRPNPSSSNSWGFRDVHGNVAKITLGLEKGQVAVHGGSYKVSLANCRSASTQATHTSVLAKRRLGVSRRSSIVWIRSRLCGRQSPIW